MVPSSKKLRYNSTIPRNKKPYEKAKYAEALQLKGRFK
jgi:hypothetical protein